MGQSVGVVAQVVSSSPVQYHWTQVAGPTVALLSNRQAAIQFDVPQVGEYDFQLVATDAQGLSAQQTHHISVTDTLHHATGQWRSDQAVSEGGVLTLRLNSDTQPLSDWHFQQVSGPTASVQTSATQPVLTLTAPQVNQDQVLVFDAIANQGLVKDRVYVLVQQQPTITSPYFCGDRGSYCLPMGVLSHHYAYHANSPYAAVLQKCTFSHQLTDPAFCTVNTLPPLGRATSTATVANIMDRVVVSEDWMGQRFEQFLTESNGGNDIQKLLGSVTAIVISPNINVSFYWSPTGAIYLNPDVFWLTPQERDGLIEQVDYRNDFGSELSFLTPWRYVQNGQYVSFFYPPNERITRLASDIWPDVASLLYHELAHANDFLPAAQRNQLDGAGVLADEIVYRRPQSDQLSAQYPLQSATLSQIAAVNFEGIAPNTSLIALTPSDISRLFFTDQANDFYNFVDTREDFAMLFEESMMKLRYHLDRDVAVTSTSAHGTRDEWLVTQGQRNRIADPQVAVRAKWVVQATLPSASMAMSTLLDTLQPTALCQGRRWDNTLNTNCAVNGLQRPQPHTGRRPASPWMRTADLPLQRVQDH
jgi:hypothetical protein